jgi:mono/diheme cytochrome c family protein
MLLLQIKDTLDVLPDNSSEMGRRNASAQDIASRVMEQNYTFPSASASASGFPVITNGPATAALEAAGTAAATATAAVTPTTPKANNSDNAALALLTEALGLASCSIEHGDDGGGDDDADDDDASDVWPTSRPDDMES